MTMSLKEVSDRLEIQGVLTSYAVAVDRHDWDRLDAVFVPAARLDYSAVADWRGTPDELRAWLARDLPPPGGYYHLMGPSDITLDGDRAVAITPCYNPMPRGDDQRTVWGLWYRDWLVRGETGWRIEERILEVGFSYRVGQTDPNR
jgi:hypothetical protein